MSRNYKFHNKAGLYFVSFATVNWVDVFTRQLYFNVLADSVSYCRAEKSMELYCYCFMPSHVHFIFRSSKNEPSELLRDFKRYTSKKVIEAIENNPQESRKNGCYGCLSAQGKRMQQQENINFATSQQTYRVVE